MSEESFPKVSPRLCEVCGGESKELLMHQFFSKLSSDVSLLSGYDIVACDNCGFCFADKIPTQDIFDFYYREMSKYEKRGRVIDETHFDQARFRKMSEIILRLLPSKQIRIFEVGCANGQLLALLKQSGYKNVTGIDPSPLSAEIAHKKYGVNVSANTLSGLPTDFPPVDFLILAGVLEHVRNLRQALWRLRQVLYTGGHIFITVPDASRYTQGEDAPFQEFSAEHINFFGESSLTNLLHNNGFQTVSIQHDMIESNYRTTTPVIHGLFKKLETVESLTVFIDIETRTDLVDYIKKSNRTDAKIQATIDNIVNKEIQIIVWGTGAHTLRLLKTSRLGQASIRVFVDSNPRYQGKQLHNSPIISPEELKVFSDPILISSRQYQEEIVSQIRGPMGMQNELIRLYRL